MASEVVMYMSIFGIGILMFGAFSISFQNYTDYAEDTALDGNLSSVVASVGSEITEMIKSAREKHIAGGTIEISINLNLDYQYANEDYNLEFNIDATGIAVLSAIVDNQIYANYSMGVIDGSGAGEIDFSGIVYSSRGNPQATYFWNGVAETLVIG